MVALLATAAVSLGIYLTPVSPEPPATKPSTAAPAAWSLEKNRPFHGTPAQDWAEGEAAIRLPEPVATGAFTAEQVGTALGKVKEFLIAGRLNRDVLSGRELEPLYAPLSANLRDALRTELEDPMSRPAFATKLAPGFRLLPGEPKINGTIHVEPGAQKGELLIKTNMVYAYAFDIDNPRQATEPIDVVTSVRIDNEFTYRDGGRWPAKHRGLDMATGRGFYFFSACPFLGQGLLAPAYADPRPKITRGAQSSLEYFDPAARLPDEITC
ncbi:hypothetical protein A4R43_12490 [Amycolatopsis albispora]|uniref:Uncharacterized protein n=1 Tax=Amycolatopsis albispora TaxID=1804986 RepID=A0A344L5E5_9PSEU|nr:hypothetical protein A4R43_12490 [Amycolatopsis albispora]